MQILVQSSNTEIKESSYYLPQMLTDLMPKLKAKESGVIAAPKWKTNVQNTATKNSIMSRTRHILNSIIAAESNISKWRRIEDLLQHVQQFPEARHYAVKNGAIRVLLRARSTAKDEQIKGKNK